MTTGLLCSVHIKQKLAINFKVKKHPDNVRLAIYYNKYKNKLTTIIRAAKINYYKNKLKELSFSPKLTWEVIKDVLDSNNNNDDDIKVIKLDDITIGVNNGPLNIANIRLYIYIRHR